MKTKALSIIPSSAVESAIVPKPTKAEIIDALAALKIEQLKAQHAIDYAERSALEIEIKAALSDLLWMPGAAGNPRFNFGKRKDRWDSNRRIYVKSKSIEDVTAVVDLKVTPEITAKLLRFYELPRDEQFRYDYKFIRESIREQLQGGNKSERVAKLLSSPESKAALQSMLASLQ